ncbi:hypothetical protein CHS0354_009678 [Potamilus streckersoni]|uniref:tRNA (guanine(9)-N(1))-methyltransferase n=1 Tax=Potamilus streckersoni TaxID=2493646 RepID=A0AAE0SMQ8_9BIVA|nr:hypothetical protein CHS0354_009678 [Potamilus streckersoni]
MGDKEMTETDENFKKYINDDSCDNNVSASAGINKKGLSKSQLRKLKKQERWQAIKADKRKAEKKRKQEKRKNCTEQGIYLGPSRKQLKFNTMEKSDCKQRVVIDCSFDEYMNDKDIRMLVQQIQHSYSANRRATSPLQLYVCGVNGKTKKRLEEIGDFKNWDVHFREENYECVFCKESIVYLSSESANVLDQLDEKKCYVIGGLVDHNHHKGLCHRLAEEKHIAHAQLPISQFMDLKTRKVLTVNHGKFTLLFEILLRFTETKDWGKAFMSVIPLRKGGIIKDTTPTDQTTSTATKSYVDKVCEDSQGIAKQEKEGGFRQEKNICLKQEKKDLQCDENISGQRKDSVEQTVNDSVENRISSVVTEIIYDKNSSDNRTEHK